MDWDWVLFVQCCDRRIQIVSQNLRKHLGLAKGNYDPISVPGGAGNLAVLKSSFETLCPIRPKKSLVVLTIHQDCAAGANLGDLMQAVAAAKKFFPQGKAYVLNLDQTFELKYSWKKEAQAFAAQA